MDSVRKSLANGPGRRAAGVWESWSVKGGVCKVASTFLSSSPGVGRSHVSWKVSRPLDLPRWRRGWWVPGRLSQQAPNGRSVHPGAGG